MVWCENVEAKYLHYSQRNIDWSSNERYFLLCVPPNLSIMLASSLAYRVNILLFWGWETSKDIISFFMILNVIIMQNFWINRYSKNQCNIGWTSNNIVFLAYITPNLFISTLWSSLYSLFTF